MTTTAVMRQRTGWTVDASTFGARLALVRQRMGWNMKEAARECGQPPATWRLWELDGVTPRRHVQVAKAIADRTGCDYLWLLIDPDEGGHGGLGVDTREYYEPARVLATIGVDRPSTRRPVRRTRPISAVRPKTPAAA